jgi:hypothetical protein
VPEINILDSASREGGIIITVSPAYKGFRITQKHYFRERLLMRFGLPYHAIPAGPCLCNSKNENLVDKEGFHLLAGCENGNQRQQTHNAVVHVLSSMLSHAGIINRTEDSKIIQSVDIYSQKRIDITADNFIPGVSLNLDVSITDPRQLHFAKPVPGKAALMREKEKISIYGETFKKAGAIFSPFVLESFGRWGDNARTIFKEIVDHMSIHGSQAFFHLPRTRVVQYWRSKITMAMHRQASIGLHLRINALNQWRQGIKNSKNYLVPVVEFDDPCAVLCAFDSCG